MKKFPFATFTLLIVFIAFVACEQTKTNTTFNGVYQTSPNGKKFTMHNDSSQSLQVEETAIVSFSDFEAMTMRSSAASGKPNLYIKMTPEGRKKFALATQENIDKPLAIIFNDQLFSAPVVREKITTGELQISGIDKKSYEKIMAAFKRKSK